MAKKAPAKKAVAIKAPVVKTQKDLTQDIRLEIVEKYLGKALEILAGHFGGECAVLKAELEAEIQKALITVEKKA
jgi:hypothetical protein